MTFNHHCVTTGFQEDFGSEDPDKDNRKCLLGKGDLADQLNRGHETAALHREGRRAEGTLFLRMEPIPKNILSDTTKRPK